VRIVKGISVSPDRADFARKTIPIARSIMMALRADAHDRLFSRREPNRGEIGGPDRKFIRERKKFFTDAWIAAKTPWLSAGRCDDFAKKIK